MWLSLIHILDVYKRKGYGKTGKFVEHLFLRNNKTIEHIVDDFLSISRNMNIERSLILKDLDRDCCAVLLCFPEDKKINHILQDLGYNENKHFVYANKIFYGMYDNGLNRPLTYYNWLEFQYAVDIYQSKMQNEIETPSQDCFFYSVGSDYGLTEVLDQFEFDERDAAFDFGCGKGGALVQFHTAGCGRVGGVEFDGNLYQTALHNMIKLGLDSSNIIKGSATGIKKPLDIYNYFYIYNSFQGRVFETTINNLEESYKRTKRNMILIYAGPYCHDIVIKNGIFRFTKSVETVFDVKEVRIYSTC